jgi:demethylmenaquinone methyltransferase/2-methoxy-6-polyprenyl-1,4-benzoquinol methylase
MRFIMPAIATATSSNRAAYDYLRESIQQWPDQGALSAWIRGVGFTRVAYRNLSAGVVALHRGHKPEDPAIRASAAKRRQRRTST